MLGACHRLALTEGQKENKKGVKMVKTANFKSRWFVSSLILIVCLCVSVGFNVFQYLITEHSPLSSFHFSWVNYQNATQTMDVVFEAVPTLVGANLSITAKIFTDSVKYIGNDGKEVTLMRYAGCPLVLGFDFDGDEKLKEGDFVFEFDNDMRHDAWFIDELHCSIASGFSDKEGWWQWSFDNKSYCTYTINFRLTSTSHYPSEREGYPQNPYNEITLKNDLLFICVQSFWRYIHFDPEGKLK